MSQKKLLIVCLSVLLLLLAACTSGAPASETPAVEEAPAAAETPAAAEEEEASEATTDEDVADEEVADEEAATADGVPAGELPAVNPLEVEGDIITAGSSTVYPLAEAVANRFVDEGYRGIITVDSIGSGAGFERFCDVGESDISNASRPIKEGEVEDCAAIGRTPIEFRVGTDALAVVVSPENDWVTDVTLEELAALFTAENWSDVNDEWPNEPIQRFIPGTDSGTFDYFVEAVFAEDAEPLLAAPNTQLSEDDNVLVQGVQGSPHAIGFFGYAYYSESSDVLSVLNIDGVEPSGASVEDGSYALARPLFIYSDAGIMNEKPQVAAYINFFLTYVNEEVTEVGYFPSSEEALTDAKNKWLEAVQ